MKASQKREAALRDELEASQFQCARSRRGPSDALPTHAVLPGRSGSIAGKKLVQKCRELQSENEQLGKDVSEGRMQQLRAEVGMHKDYASEQRKSIGAPPLPTLPPLFGPSPSSLRRAGLTPVGEMREWIEQLSDELEVAQGTIFSLRRELKDEKAMHERSSRD